MTGQHHCHKASRGTGVVIMNKYEYVNPLGQASINDTLKLTTVSLETKNKRPTSNKYHHSLFAEGKTSQICSTEQGSRLTVAN